MPGPCAPSHDKGGAARARRHGDLENGTAVAARGASRAKSAPYSHAAGTPLPPTKATLQAFVDPRKCCRGGQEGRGRRLHRKTGGIDHLSGPSFLPQGEGQGSRTPPPFFDAAIWPGRPRCRKACLNLDSFKRGGRAGRRRGPRLAPSERRKHGGGSSRIRVPDSDFPFSLFPGYLGRARSLGPLHHAGSGVGEHAHASISRAARPDQRVAEKSRCLPFRPSVRAWRRGRGGRALPATRFLAPALLRARVPSAAAPRKPARGQTGPLSVCVRVRVCTSPLASFSFAPALGPSAGLLPLCLTPSLSSPLCYPTVRVVVVRGPSASVALSPSSSSSSSSCSLLLSLSLLFSHTLRPPAVSRDSNQPMKVI
jgi:hypothetical protein